MHRKETTILPISMLNGGLSHRSKPVLSKGNEIENETEGDFTANISELQLPDELENRMFSHQREGI
jgi:hypothetical protein